MFPDVILNGAARRIEGPLLYLERRIRVGLNEAVEVLGTDGTARPGRVVAMDESSMVVEVLEPTLGLATRGTRVRFLGRPLHFGVGTGLLGRTLDGVGRPLDSGPPVGVAEERPIDGLAINPTARALPTDFIETGVTAVDLLNSLVRGQKLPIFSGSGLPHARISIEIAQYARLLKQQSQQFSIVFAGIGVPHTVAEQFRRAMQDSGALKHTVLFLNLADDSTMQRLLTPRYALTAAEYLAFTEGRHVLVILTDMTNYCEALREVSSSHGEIPGRKGYPGYLYSDLATLFERAGRIHGLPGSLTQLPVLTMPGDDISHPIPDMTGYITEGQIVLDRQLDRHGVYPPIAVLPSLSRLIDQGIGAGFTDADHPALASQLYTAYARAVQVRVLASVVGETGLPASDRLYLKFGDDFETGLIHQTGPRSLGESMELGWRLLRTLPVDELSRLNDAQLARHIQAQVRLGG